MKIAIITAGGAGMYCGSCIHDNTWARALISGGHEALLIPCYTPLRLDEQDLSVGRIFMGGINLYLEGKYRWWRRLPCWTKRWLDARWILKAVSQLAVSSQAKDLGEMTVSMLKGAHQQSFEELAGYLLGDLKPDLVVFSNALMSGPVEVLRSGFRGPILCMLQGDDLFLQGLPEPWRTQALARIRELSQHFDGFVTHSRYYADSMREYLGIANQPFYVIPLAIDTNTYLAAPRNSHHRPPVVGYFARICQAKGLHRLVEAALQLKAQGREICVRAAGYLPPYERNYLAEVQKLARPLGDGFRYEGSPPHLEGKLSFLDGLDLFCVPTEYAEPKGIFLLEAMARGLPVVQPAHGAFPELVAGTGGGVLFDPKDQSALASALARLLDDRQLRHGLSLSGRSAIVEKHSLSALCQASEQLFESLLQEKTR